MSSGHIFKSSQSDTSIVNFQLSIVHSKRKEKKSMKKTIFTGMATAIVTPMTKDGIDFEALGRFLEFQIENGINAIVVMGTTGENATIE